MTRDSSTGRRQFVKAAGLLAGIGATGVAAGDAEDTTPKDESGDRNGDGGETNDECLFDGPGFVTVESDQAFDATVEAIENRIEQSPLTLMTTVDHAANAESVDMDLPPTTLLLFGNPAVGTQLMQSSRSTAIDLPQKLLVWCEEGTVNVTYNDPEYLAARHGIEGKEEVIETIADALRTLATGENGNDTDGSSD
ncbi:DUF302 domain-containing protein [Haloarcula nitratireducens]|uniref:DUF302 domain-containing protein n=1 Tax=Haloarcula nitratireducens TaxID=2487749 RepID=A0AAW4PBY2_9EURY|nr:DUF302 domain-containing protein [Halomicroarcula nitratireducens]MBX0295409.1 DUF302 domain-containing protein [Halomicroarcula nitratireducens]